MIKHKTKNKDQNFNTYAMNSNRPHVSGGEFFLKFFVYLLTFIVIALLLVIIIFVAAKSANVFENYGFFKFIFTDDWNPSGKEFGIGGIIASTLMMLIIALVFAVPLTLFSSLFISEYLGKKTRKFVMTLVQLLAGVPSVVFGLFAIDQIGPMFVAMGASSNGNMMTASFTLAFMALPTMLSLSYNAIQNVPESYRFASLGLGITKERTTFSIVRRAATPKMISAVIMGMARVVGETMAVILIAGNSPAGLKAATSFSTFIFASIKTLAGTIGLEMLENGGPEHESALYAIGLILFILVIIINLVVLLVSNADKYKQKRLAKQKRTINPDREAAYDDYQLNTIVKIKADGKAKKTTESVFGLFFMITSTIIVLAFIVWVLGVVLIKGLIGLQYASAFISVNGKDSGIFASFFTTILLIISTLVFAIPLALGTAIYLSEFAKKNSPLTKILRFVIDLLASTPSIVFGIFGLSVFIVMFGLPMSIFASSLTMAIVVVPMLTSNFEDALSLVPQSYREAAYSLGLTKAQTLFKVTIPNAMKGLGTGIILAVAKIIGETAPVYLTLGTAVRMPVEGFMASGATLTTEIYMLTSEGGSDASISKAYLFSLVTMILVYVFNWLSTLVSFDSGAKKVSVWERWREWWKSIFTFNYGEWFTNVWKSLVKANKKLGHELNPKQIKKSHKQAVRRRKQLKKLKEVGDRYE